MRIDKPEGTLTLRQLWQEAFGDTDAFLDCFFTTAFSPDRCRCVTESGRLLGALYWFDVYVQGQKYAYIYAVATAGHSRGKGVCHALIADTNRHLADYGYSGSMLVPETEALRRFYAGMGYVSCTCVQEQNVRAGGAPVAAEKVTVQQYAALRSRLLPEGGVVQEGENLSFLQAQYQLYAGEDWLLTAYPREKELFAMEYLGDTEKCPGILQTLGFAQGSFRMPGTQQPFAMYLPFTKESEKPAYFGLAFD